MARSMTGYGVGTASSNGRSVTVELRSVNNRFLDLNLRLPRTLNQHDPDVRELIRKRLVRGRISILINDEWNEDRAPDIRLDRARALGYARELEELRRELNLEGQLQLEHLLTADDLFTTGADDADRETLWGLCREALDRALDQMIAAGKSEAEALCSDIRERTDGIRGQLDLIKRVAENMVVDYHQRLRSRLGEILEDSRIDQARLETEIALAADRYDISEEIVRLDSHLQMFSSAIDKDGPIGKTLGFILQEMGREANTIASKSWALGVSQAAIKIKEYLEQIREQVQNLE